MRAPLFFAPLALFAIGTFHVFPALFLAARLSLALRFAFWIRLLIVRHEIAPLLPTPWKENARAASVFQKP